MQQELKIIVKEDGTAQVTGKLDKLNHELDETQRKSKLSVGKEFFGGMVSGALTAAGAFLSVRAALNTANRSLTEFTDAFSVMREVQNTLNSTGRAAEFTTQELADMASEIQQVTAIGDNDILRGATIGLLRFDSISKEMFPRVQRLAVDMSKAMGGVEGAAKTLGIAMSDPVLGISRMRKAGVDLNDTQKELIKSFVETGNKAAAQGILLDALEAKYSGLAQAGVTGAALLKEAWGEYLEALGGSISVIDGIKRGLAQFFFDVAADSQNLSTQQMKHILDVQERWAIFTLEAAQRGKQAITIMGGVTVSIFGLLQDTLNAVYFSFNNVYQAFISVFNGLGKIAPRFMEAITGVSTFKEAFNDLKDDFTIGSKKMVSIDAFGESSQKNLKNWIALFGNANTSIQQGTQDINAFYDAQRKLVDSGKNPFTGMDMTEGETAAGFNAQIDAAQKEQIAITYTTTGELLAAWAAYYTSLDQYSNESIEAQAVLYKNQIQQQYGTILSMQQIDEMYNAKLWELRDAQLAHFEAGFNAQTESVRDMQAEMLTAWAAYYGTLDQYSNESIQAQADLYRVQIQQQYGTILSMQQIDQMYNAKLWELRDKQLAHFAENYEQMPEIVEESMSRIAQITQESVDDIQRSGFNLLNNSIYDLISGTKSLKDVWSNAWAAMQEIALRAMSEIISKLIVTVMWQEILKATMGSTFGFNAPTPGTGVWTQPVPIPTFGTGRSGINPSIADSGMGSVMNELRSLRMAISDNREQNFNLYMDGVPLRNALKRVETRLNYMGSGA